MSAVTYYESHYVRVLNMYGGKLNFLFCHNFQNSRKKVFCWYILSFLATKEKSLLCIPVTGLELKKYRDPTQATGHKISVTKGKQSSFHHEVNLLQFLGLFLS